MIQQTESEQDEIVSIETKEEEKKIDEEKTNRFQAFAIRFFGDPKQKGQMIYNATFFFIIGLVFSFAPEYMQTNISWVTNTSAVLCFSCWGISLWYIQEVYPGFPKDINSVLNITLVLSSTLAIGFYILSETGGKPLSYPSFLFELRMMSFLGFLMTVMTLVIRFPDFVNFYKHHKGKMKAFFTAKHTIGLVLGFLAVGTALFQFLQIVLQIFHL